MNYLNVKTFPLQHLFRFPYTKSTTRYQNGNINRNHLFDFRHRSDCACNRILQQSECQAQNSTTGRRVMWAGLCGPYAGGGGLSQMQSVTWQQTCVPSVCVPLRCCGFLWISAIVKPTNLRHAPDVTQCEYFNNFICWKRQSRKKVIFQGISMYNSAGQHWFKTVSC